MTPPKHSRDSSSRNRWGKPPWSVTFRPRRKALPDRVDIVIVGGGFAGLSAAAHVKKYAHGKSVLLLETGKLGNGASGRTGGMALDETAAGPLSGAKKVLAAYRKILRQLNVQADLSLPGAWEIGRGGGAPSLEGEPKRLTFKKDSPISWFDSGHLRVVRKVAGGTVDPGKVLTGLARAAQRAGVHIAEHAEVRSIDFDPLKLHIASKSGVRSHEHTISADRVLLAANAGAIDAAALPAGATPRLTFALATAPLARAQIAALGLAHAQPFYTVDLPYLWGRRFAGNRLIFGSGLVPAFGKSLCPSQMRSKALWRGLESFDVRRGEPAERLRSLEQRVRALHPVLQRVRITHRWCGPILITKDWHPIFRSHAKSARVLVLGGFSGHGVALSVFLGRWAAQALLGRRAPPQWG